MDFAFSTTTHAELSFANLKNSTFSAYRTPCIVLSNCAHKERCLAFALACGRPFALLLPAYVAEKKYFADACARTGAAPFFVSPARGRPPYEYAHPHGTDTEEWSSVRRPARASLSLCWLCEFVRETTQPHGSRSVSTAATCAAECVCRSSCATCATGVSLTYWY